MQKFTYLLGAVVILSSLYATLALSFSASTHAQTVPTRRIVIAADTVFDGKGHVLKKTRIVSRDRRLLLLIRRLAQSLTISGD